MPSFPILKTGAVAQYPATRAVRYRNETVRFVDGTDQRYRDGAGPLRRWKIALDLLEEGELAAMEAFFGEVQGTFQSFAFTDPWDGTEYPNCALESDDFEAMVSGEMRGAAALVVAERR